MNLNNQLHLTAKRLHNSSCIEVKWRRIESAACDVKYVVSLKDSHGMESNKSVWTNVEEAKVCSASQYVTEVQLTVKFRKMSKTITAFVAENTHRLHKETSTIPC